MAKSEEIPEDNEALLFINIIRPEHCRTSCSDENISNGFYTYDGVDWLPRCVRCGYLELIKGWPPKGFDPERWTQ